MDKEEINKVLELRNKVRARKVAELEKYIRDSVINEGLSLGDALLVLDVIQYDLLKSNSDFMKKIYAKN